MTARRRRPPPPNWATMPNAGRKRKMMTITVSDEARAELVALAEVHGSISGAVEALALASRRP